MMSKIRLLPLLMLFFSLTVLAEAEPLILDYAIVYTTSPSVKKVWDPAAWAKEVASGRYKILDQGTCAAKWDGESSAFMGRNMPSSYYDPRAEASQVQYTKVGFRLDCTPKSLPGGLVLLSLRIEKSQLLDVGGARDAFTTDSQILLKKGQTAVVGTTRGVMTGTYLSAAYPRLPLGDDVSIMLTISAR